LQFPLLFGAKLLLKRAFASQCLRTIWRTAPPVIRNERALDEARSKSVHAKEMIATNSEKKVQRPLPKPEFSDSSSARVILPMLVMGHFIISKRKQTPISKVGNILNLGGSADPRYLSTTYGP
jgi:hypothetical protein